MKHGFTLVELSIVLVVIGLLVGGILAAQSMVKTAKIHTLAKEVQQLNIPVNLFKQRFKYYPGDIPHALDNYGFHCHQNYVDSHNSGDGNGLIDKNAATGWEQELFWCQLHLTGMLNLSSVVKIDGFIKSGMISKFDKKIDWNAGGADNSPLCKPGFHVGNCFYFGSTDDNNVSMLPIDAAAIDNKLDDGVPSTGSVRAIGQIYNAPAQNCGDWQPGGFPVPAYYMDATSDSCYLAFEIKESGY